MSIPGITAGAGGQDSTYKFEVQKRYMVDHTIYRFSISKMEITAHDNKAEECWKNVTMDKSTGEVKWKTCPKTHSAGFSASGQGVGCYIVVKVTWSGDVYVEDEEETTTTPTTTPTTSSTGGTTTTPTDTTKPTVTVTPQISGNTSSNPSNSSQVKFNIKFSESVSGLVASELSVSGGGSVASLTGSGSSYVATVNTVSNSDYGFTLSVPAGVCKDSAGNTNKSGTSSTFYIDRINPRIDVSTSTISGANTSTTNGVTRVNGTDTTLTLKFNARDKHSNSSNKLSASDITVTIGGVSVGNSYKSLTSTWASGTENGYNYTLTISKFADASGNLLNGSIDAYVGAGKIVDIPGNSNVKTSILSLSSGISSIVIDNTKPELKTATISGNQYGYVKNDSTVTLKMTFSEDLKVKPTVKIGGRVATVTGSGSSYTATYNIAATEKTLTEGELSVEISDYMDLVGLVGNTVTKTTDGSKVIYDRTVPTVTNIDPNGNPVWQKSQSVIISVTDNFTAKKDITGEYEWIESQDTSLELNNEFVNDAKITKNTGTGKFELYLTVRDLAGNQIAIRTNEFYIDNSVTEVGTVKITENSATGEEYKTHEKTTEDGIVYEGGYTGEKLYIHKIDGKDEESGHKRTEYKVTRLEDNQEIVIGSSSVEDTIIENDGDYKITVTTYDNLNNKDTRIYIIHKGSVNVSFSPDGNNSYEAKVSTKVTLTDETGLANKMYYQWVKEGEELKNFTQEIVSGKTVSLSGVTGEYRVYVKTVDKDGNENITKSNKFYIAGKIANMGTMIFKYRNEAGEDYTPDTYTNQNIYMRIGDHGSDPYGGTVTSTYKINKKETDGTSISIGTYTNESTVLVDEGEYTVTLTSVSELGASNSVTYKVKIDKTEPTINFYGIDTYQQTGQIQVQIIDEGICVSGVNESTLKYYWTRSKNTPTKDNFEGEENEYRGTISSASSIIKGPSDVSGIWYLWVYAEDNAGNACIKSNVKIEGGNVSYVDNDPPVAGTIKMTEETEEKKAYEEGTFTKESVRIELLNGYDADSGVKSNTYSIKKNGSTYRNNLTEDFVLTEHGIYTVTVTTVDNQNNKSTREYTIKIDKEGPEITFSITNENDYSMSKEVQITLDDKNYSGVNESKTTYKWIGYNPYIYESFEEVQEIMKYVTDVNELAEMGIYVESGKVVNNKVTTPEKATGIYYLFVTAEDNLGNTSTKTSGGLKLDNTNPTSPEVYAYEKDTKDPYYGVLTNKDIVIEAKNSQSLSGVDKYIYKVSKDYRETWSEWKETEIENGIGKVTISEEGITNVRIKAVAVLVDGSLESEESEEIIVRIDKTGPSVTFSNYNNGENGNSKLEESVLVRATVTDQNNNNVNPNSLKYEWIKFQTEEEFDNFNNREKDIQTLKAMMSEKAKAFGNGEELPSPSDAEGIYSLFVYAEDALGNASVCYSNSYQLGKPKTTDKTEDGILYGDLNGDELVDLIDLSILQQYIVHDMEVDEEFEKAADVNQDGEVDIRDLSKLIFKILGL